MSITFYSGINRAKFTNSTEPTIEGQAGTDSLAQAVSAGGQVSDLMDGNRQTLLTASFDTTVVTNGTFGADSGWGKTNFWSIGSGVASVPGGAGTSNLTQTALVVGVKYSVTFDVSAYAFGSVTVKLGTTTGTARSSAGTFSETLTCAGNTTLTFTTPTGAALSIDNVVVKPLDLRFDLAADERVDVACLILDNTDIWDALPDAARGVVDVHYHTSDSFSAATRLTPTKVYGGLLGKGRPYLDIDGVDDYVEVPDHNSLDITGQGLTLEDWIKPGSTRPGRIISKRGGTGDWEIDIWQDVIRFTMSGTVIATVSFTTVNTWTHLVGTYDGSNARIYVDGVERVSTTYSGTLAANSNSLYIGRLNGSSTPYDGTIDEVRIWSVARSQAEIQGSMHSQLTGSETGLVGYWRMDEASGLTVFDYTANANHGTLNGGVTRVTSTIPVPDDTTPPAAPTGLAVTGVSGGTVTLSWNANAESDLKEYRVYQGTATGFDTTGNQVGVAAEPTTGYTATGLSTGTPYYFRVAAVDNAGNVSALSEEVSATPSTDPPPAAPATLVAVAGNGQAGLSWDANNEADLKEYWVYQGTATGFDTTGTRVGVVAQPSTIYTATNLNNDTPYYFVVAAVDNAGNVSA
ncbi:MAG: fibronectin type III domain-containing protein, partial [Candidatus Marinimicrobia bacterium]|nr:fibronectin type III domain-containing protein [Candidatus Neomarinimicrobiota bacterium]